MTERTSSTEHALKQLIADADRAITAEDFDRLMDFYADDALLVIKPGTNAVGKPAIRQAFVAIAAHFGNSIRVRQGAMQVLEGADTALVIMETHLDITEPDGAETCITRRATYVFRRGADGRWLCAVDNSYGTDLLNAPAP